METSFQPTTFVPKRPIISTEGSLRPKRHLSFFKVVSIIVFLFAVALAAGLFAYKYVLTRSNESKKAEIEEAIKNFEPDLTKQLTLLKARFDAAKKLLENHAALTVFLSLLEANTAQTVRYSDFKYLSADGGNPIINMKGESATFGAIAFQSETLSKNPIFKTAFFSGLNVNETGLISFSVKAELDPSGILYKKSLGSADTNTPAPAPTPATASSTLPGTGSTTQP